MQVLEQKENHTKATAEEKKHGTESTSTKEEEATLAYPEPSLPFAPSTTLTPPLPESGEEEKIESDMTASETSNSDSLFAPLLSFDHLPNPQRNIR